jgi:hypothetical protein
MLLENYNKTLNLSILCCMMQPFPNEIFLNSEFIRAQNACIIAMNIMGKSLSISISRERTFVSKPLGIIYSFMIHVCVLLGVCNIIEISVYCNIKSNNIISQYFFSIPVFMICKPEAPNKR